MMKPSAAAVRELIGGAICLGAVVLTVLIWHGSPEPPSVLPLVFLIIVVWIAIQFGRHAGFFSTIAAASTLAFFVYKPVANFAINDRKAAGYIAALVIGGLISSELLADSPEHQHLQK